MIIFIEAIFSFKYAYELCVLVCSFFLFIAFDLLDKGYPL